MASSAAVSLLASSARTTTGSGAAVDLAEKTTCVLYLDVTAVSGTGTLTVTVQTSPNGTSGWTTVSPSAGSSGSTVFTAASAVGLQKVTFPDCSQYVRASWSITGGATFTFSVLGTALLRFAAVADVLRFGVRAAGLSDVSAVDIDASCGRATDEIVSALDAQEYKGPFDAWGEDVRGSAATLAGYYALLARGFRPDDGADPIVQAVADVRAWLDLVAKGSRRPFGVADSTDDEDEGDAYVHTSTARGW